MNVQKLSITDFLTDGSLALLCESASRLLGKSVTLRDPQGLTIVSLEGGGWTTSPVADVQAPGEFSAPLTIGDKTLGRIVISSDAKDDEPEAESVARRFIDLLAKTISEVCTSELEQRRRAQELQALYKLSSMLVGVASIETLLEAGLRSVAEALGVDAGVIKVIDQETGKLAIRASVTLSDCNCADPASLPPDEALEQAALTGDVVCGCGCEDGLSASLCDSLQTCGFGAVISTGLLFQSRALGIVTLCTKEARRFTERDRGLLQSVCQQLAVAVANARLAQNERHARRVQDQVALAADVQRRMLPEALPDTPNLDLAARYTPCFELGGDFYDVFPFGERIGLVIGDIVGKGVAAAMLMSHLRATLRAHARDLDDIAQIIEQTNQALCRDTLVNEFATIFVAAVDPGSLRLTYSNAGHDPPIVSHATERGPRTAAALSELTTGGMVIGVDPHQRYQSAIFDLRHGDVLLMYTDGLADAMNFDGDKFGAARVRSSMIDAINASPDATAKQIADHIHWEMRRFAGLAKRTDDTTLLVMRVRGEGVVESSSP